MVAIWLFLGKTLVAALIISFCSWLSNKKPDLAGFIVALPLTTILVLLFSQVEFEDSGKSVAFAKSIFVGIPVSMMFFVPFLLAEQLKLGFWGCFSSGCVLISFGYFAHKGILTLIS